jgi:hypothetical protein
MSYVNEIPFPNKFLMPDGSIQTFAGAMWAPADAKRADWYVKHQWFPAKWLLPDGSIVSGLPLDMTPFEAIFVPKTTKINGHALTGDITLIPEDIGLHDVFEYKGVIDCSANPNYPAADAGWAWKVSVAGRIGGVNGKVVEVGDTIFCNHDGTPVGDETAVGAYWDVVQANWDIDYPVDENDFLIGDSSPVRWSKKTLAETGAILEGDIEHNNLQSLQGGDTINSYMYHLNAADYGYLTDAMAQLENLQRDGSPTFATIRLYTGGAAGSILISDTQGNASWSANIATTGALGRVIVGDGLTITAGGVLTVDEPQTDHNYLNMLQGGSDSPLEYYHLTSAEHTVVQNTSGSNTGDQDSSDFDHNSLQNTHNLTSDISHNNISDLQGGSISPEEYYHVTSAEKTVIENTSGSNTGDQSSSDFTHNDLSSLQGGQAGQRYHLTAAELSAVQSMASAIRSVTVILVAHDTNCSIGTSLGGDFECPITGNIVACGAYNTIAGSDSNSPEEPMTVDILVNGTTIFQDSPDVRIEINSGEKTSRNNSPQTEISNPAVVKGDIITFNVDYVHTTPAKGLNIWFEIQE